MFIFLTILISCSDSNSPNEESPFRIIETKDVDTSHIKAQILSLASHPDEFDYQDLFEEVSNETQNILPYLVSYNIVKYKSTDNDGNEIELSGLFIYPYRLIQFERIQTPIICVTHGTELLKKYAPSHWDPWGVSDWGNFAEALIANVMAIRYGWTILMPDYQGMGFDLDENHPYCNREKLAIASADMIEKGIEMIKNNKHKNVNWDGNLFVYGYSEGGFVSMATTQELEKRKINLTGAVCMDGPYDLTGTMKDVMLSDEAFPVPYFLPLMLVGYNTMYPDYFAYDEVLKEPYRTDIPKYTDGLHDKDVVNGIMPSSNVLKDVFTTAFIDSLNNTGSNAYNTLKYNNTFYNWTPKTKMLMWHCKNDDCVPFGNFTAAKNAFENGGATGITYVEWPEVYDWSGTVHVSVAPRAFYEGASWIYQQLK
jgi:hypothetical protein